MDKEELKGVAQKIKGNIKKVVGKLVGNRQLETEGKTEAVVGSARQAVGEDKAAIRDIVRENTK